MLTVYTGDIRTRLSDFSKGNKKKNCRFKQTVNLSKYVGACGT